ncbi:MAG: cupin domain-containing protein [Acetobacteraceae bacterium]|nr:cupin domain-containing protein [Acetobacteraceae bacterium]
MSRSMRSLCRSRRNLLLGWPAGALCFVAAGSRGDSARVEIHGSSGDSKQAVQLTPEGINFRSVEGKPGVYSANVVGKPSVLGVYVVCVKMEGRKQSASYSPDGRATTVITGKVLYGLGDRIAPESAKVYGPGSFYYTPPSTPHYLVATEGEVIYEEAGTGPSASIPVPSR